MSGLSPSDLKVFRSNVMPDKAAPKTKIMSQSSKDLPAEHKKVAKTATEDKKKRRAKHQASFNTYIYKVLKQVHPDVGISKKSMSVMNSLVKDIFSRLAEEAKTVNSMTRSSTLSSRSIQTAARLVLPGEVSKHAVSEGTKAVTKYSNSKSS